MEKTEQLQAMEHSADNMLSTAQELKILSDGDYSFQAGVVKEIKRQWQGVEDKRKELKAPIDDAAQGIQDFFMPVLKKLKSAETIRKNAMVVYDNEQERLRLEEEQRIADELAKKKDDNETKAIEAREDGDEAKAISLEVQSNALPVQVKIEKPKVAGVSRTKTWKYKVVDIDKVPRTWLQINDKALAQFAKSTKGQSPVGGVEFYAESNVRIGA